MTQILMASHNVFLQRSTQEEMMGLISQFRGIDVEERGSVDKQSVMKAVQDSREANYDQVRETLKEVNLDSSGRVELEDYVDVSRGVKHMHGVHWLTTFCGAAVGQAASRSKRRRRRGHKGQGDCQGQQCERAAYHQRG